VDYKRLLIRYVAHVAMAEGIDFACKSDMAPCILRGMAWTEEDVDTLYREIFPEVRKWASQSE
jgi:hypothetical protein